MADDGLEISALRAELLTSRLLLSEAEHRAKNTLQMAVGLLLSQARHASLEPRAVMMRAAHRLAALAASHAVLLASDHQRIAVGEALENLCSAYGALRDDVVIRVRTEPMYAKGSHVVALHLIALELVINALKHAFPDGRHGEVELRLSRLDGQGLNLVVEDNGIGCRQESVDGVGSGLMKALAAQLGGRLDTTCTPGLGRRTSLVIPDWSED